jgi:DUF1009 family protein
VCFIADMMLAQAHSRDVAAVFADAASVIMHDQSCMTRVANQRRLCVVQC